MLKSAVFTGLLLLSICSYGQNAGITMPLAPYSQEHFNLISDLSTSFNWVSVIAYTPEPEESWKKSMPFTLISVIK
jgi:hypothetical protein